MQKHHCAILGIFLTGVILAGCRVPVDRNNPFHHHRNIHGIEGLKEYSYLGGAVLGEEKNEFGRFKYGIGVYRGQSDAIVCVFKQYIDTLGKNELAFKILDTINVGQIDKAQYLSYCNCRKDTVLDQEIIALVVATGQKEYYNQIIKAWRANRKTGQFEVIKKTDGISCFNEGSGADGSGDEEKEQPEDK